MLLTAQVFLFHLTSVSSNVIRHFTSCSSTWTPLAPIKLLLLNFDWTGLPSQSCTCMYMYIIHAKTTRAKNTAYADVYCIGCVPSSFPRAKVKVSP